jgi:hypothetical protein
VNELYLEINEIIEQCEKHLSFFFRLFGAVYIQFIFKQEIKSPWTKIKSEKHKRKFEASSECKILRASFEFSIPSDMRFPNKKKTTRCHLLLTIPPDLNPIETASCSAARIFLVQSYFIHSVTTKTKSLRQSRQQDKQFRTEKKFFSKSDFRKNLAQRAVSKLFRYNSRPRPFSCYKFYRVRGVGFSGGL